MDPLEGDNRLQRFFYQNENATSAFCAEVKAEQKGGVGGAAATGRVRCYQKKQKTPLILGPNVVLKTRICEFCNPARLGRKCQDKACWQLWRLKALEGDEAAIFYALLGSLIETRLFSKYRPVFF